MKYLLVFASFLILTGPMFTQQGNPVTLDSCYTWALDHNPLGQSLALQEQATRIELEKLDAGRLPDIYLNGSAQFQSENVKVPFEIPGEEPVELPLFVAQAAVDVNYDLYDGGITAAQRQVSEASLLAEKQEVATSLDRLKARINDLYFALLLRRSGIEVMEASIRSLESRREAIQVAVAQGAALPSESAQLEAEILRLQARMDDERAGIRSAAAQLSHLTGRPIDPDATLSLPEPGPLPPEGALQRKELEKFNLQKQEVLAREALISAGRRPRVSLFGRGGFGYPNPLNFFDEKVSPFGLVGLRFRWNLFNWNQSDLERQLLSIRQSQIDLQRELFEFDIQTREQAFRENIASLEQQLETDRRLVELETGILAQKALQLEQGVTTSAAYIEQESRLATARLQEQTHRLQWIKARVDYETEKGLR